MTALFLTETSGIAYSVEEIAVASQPYASDGVRRDDLSEVTWTYVDAGGSVLVRLAGDRRALVIEGANETAFAVVAKMVNALGRDLMFFSQDYSFEEVILRPGCTASEVANIVEN